MIKCKSCEKYFTPTESDKSRLDDAIKSKMPLLIINCTICNNQNFIKAEELNVEKKDVIKDLRKKEIPNKYKEFLNATKNMKISIFKKEDDFKLYSYDELKQMVNIDGVMYYQMSEILGYVKTIAMLALENIEENVKLLENSISIGYENTRILFIDSRQDNSFLYIFHPDGGDVEKTDIRINNVPKLAIQKI